MRLTIHRSKSGDLYATKAGIRIHSSYDPIREAYRFVEKELPPPPPQVAIVIGSGFGYIEDKIRSLYPSCRVLSLECDSTFIQHRMESGETIEDTLWHPGSSESLHTFLRRHIHELSSGSVRLIEWPAGTKAFAEVSTAIRKTVVSVIRELNGNIMTISKFGRRWIRNTLVNALSSYQEYVLEGVTGAVFIAASGANLVACLPFLQQNRRRISLWALPSSLRFLKAHRIVPDLVVQTDPGYYASVHLRHIPDLKIPIATPVSACPPPPGSRLFFFYQDTLAEHLLPGEGKPTLRIPENGTVAGTALQLAVGTGASAVFFGGLDLCHHGIVSHVKPHSFDELLAGETSRLHPLLSLLAERQAAAGARGWSESCTVTTPLRTFADWFNRFCPSCDTPIYRLFPSAVSVAGTTPVNHPQAVTALEKYPMPEMRFVTNNPGLPSSAIKQERLDSMARTLATWAGDISTLSREMRSRTISWDGANIRYPFDVIRYWDFPGLLKAYRSSDMSAFNRIAIGCTRELTELRERMIHAFG